MQTAKLATLAGLAITIGASLPIAPPAAAADLGPPPSARPPADFRPPYGRGYDISPWAGFYFGGTVGQTWGSATTGGDIGKWPFDQDGTVGTIFAGYNWHLGNTVFGLETDLGTGSVSGSALTDLGVLRTELNSFGSFRGRAGFLVSPALLVYATAGLAWQNMDFTLDGLETSSKTLWGYQVGLGTELMLSNHVGVRFEYIYTDLEKTDVTHSGLKSTYDPDHHTLRAGVTFKF